MATRYQRSFSPLVTYTNVLNQLIHDTKQKAPSAHLPDAHLLHVLGPSLVLYKHVLGCRRILEYTSSAWWLRTLFRKLDLRAKREGPGATQQLKGRN